MIQIGSNYFFKGIEGFKSKDEDWLEIADNPIDFKISYQLTGKGKCHFKWKRMSPEEFIRHTLKRNFPMEIGKFLIPQFNDEIGFTIDHLKQLENLSNELDDKHKYEKIIFDSYLENNAFYLTGDQLLKAFEEYKKYRI
jgi:hypothetical protein